MNRPPTLLPRARTSVALVVLLTAGACGGSSTARSTTSTPGPSVVPTSPSGGGSPCTVRANPAPGPITDPNGPMFHQVAIARTTDGLMLADAQIVQPAASVPDGVRAADGRVLVYYVNGAQGGLWVGVATATSLTPIGPITIDGIRDSLGVVDPDAYRVGDRIRLAYLANFTSPNERAICLADSDDGEVFRTVGMAIDLRGAETITDPSVVRLSSGSWLMALSAGQTTLLARSSDGVSFVVGERLTFGGVPEVAALGDGAVRLYVCSGGIVAYRSADATSWQREQTVATRGPNGSMLVCDPSRVAGTDLFVFKTGM